MTTFSLPVIRTGGQKLLAPERVPVTFNGEHVADAVFDNTCYSVTLYYGDLQRGLASGSLALVAEYNDAPAGGSPNAYNRTYTGLAIVDMRSR